MSKAFDTVNRNTLVKNLETILDDDEIHLLAIITNRPEIKIKLENTTGNSFETYQGIMQGDCLSAVLFIYYLACALSEEHIIQHEDHSYVPPPEKELNINPKYADDITYITTNEEKHREIENITAIRLKKYNLQINRDKTERFEVPETPKEPVPIPTPKEYDGRPIWSDLDWLLPPRKPPDPPPAWAICKLLGTKLGTETDIKNRKGLVISVMKELYYIFKSKFISNKLKLREFETYISSIFLYNSETWSLSETLNKKIDAFQRKQLRYALNIHYPKTISNEKLYRITRAEPWSRTIKRRRLNLYGHVLRLNEQTPIRQALFEAVKPVSRGRGRPPIHWLQTIQKDLADELMNLGYRYSCPEQFLQITHHLAQHRTWWKGITRCVMSSNKKMEDAA